MDVFAPGEAVYCAVPGSSYGFQSGTSIATPGVSLTAALVWSAHPEYTAVQIKDIILRSVTKIDHPIVIRAAGKPVRMSDICVSGGVANAYNAMLLADKYGR